jgi:hypothetical protein
LRVQAHNTPIDNTPPRMYPHLVRNAKQRLAEMRTWGCRCACARCAPIGAPVSRDEGVFEEWRCW